MNKEQILSELKSLVQSLIDDQEKLKGDEDYKKEWGAKQQALGIEVKKLNSCDASWLNDQYGLWFRTEIKPKMPPIDPSVKDKLLWR